MPENIERIGDLKGECFVSILIRAMLLDSLKKLFYVRAEVFHHKAQQLLRNVVLCRAKDEAMRRKRAIGDKAVKKRLGEFLLGDNREREGQAFGFIMAAEIGIL